MAIEELNAAGGVLGRPLEAVVRDGASDPATFRAARPSGLITADGVAATFGLLDIVGPPKQVTPVIEARRAHPLLSRECEGLESSPFTVYPPARAPKSIRSCPAS